MVVVIEWDQPGPEGSELVEYHSQLAVGPGQLWVLLATLHDLSATNIRVRPEPVEGPQ